MKPKAVLVACSILLFFVGEVSLGQVVPGCPLLPSDEQFSSLVLSGNYKHFNDRSFQNRSNYSETQLSFQGLSVSNTDRWGFRLDGMGSLNYSSKLNVRNLTISTEAQIRRFLNTSNFFVFGGGHISAFESSLSRNLVLTALSGAGISEIYDITPYTKALLINEEIVKRDAFDQDLPDDVIDAIAKEIANLEGAPLSEQLERVVTLIGIDLSLDDILRVHEIIGANITRFCGGGANLSLGYQIVNGSRTEEPVLKASANYSIPLGIRGELTAKANWLHSIGSTDQLLDVSLGLYYLLTRELAIGFTYSYISAKLLGGQGELHSVETTVDHLVTRFARLALKWRGAFGSDFDEAEWELAIGLEVDIF